MPNTTSSFLSNLPSANLEAWDVPILDSCPQKPGLSTLNWFENALVEIIEARNFPIDN